MRYLLSAILGVVLFPSVALAQADCEPQPNEPQPQPMPEPRAGDELPLPMPERTSETRPDVDTLLPEGQCDGGAIPEVLNGTFVAPKRANEAPAPGVMANVCEDMGDWKGAAEAYEREGNWRKAAENWHRYSKDLVRMGHWQEAGDASKMRFRAEQKAAIDEVKKAQKEIEDLLEKLKEYPGDEGYEKDLKEARKRHVEATARWKAAMKAERDEPARLAAEAKAAAAKAAEDARKAEEARKKAAEDAARAEAEKKAADARVRDAAARAQSLENLKVRQAAEARAAEEMAAEDRRRQEEENRKARIEEDRKTLDLMKKLGVIDVTKIGEVPLLWNKLPELLQTPVGAAAEEVAGVVIPVDLIGIIGGFYKLVAAHLDPRTTPGKRNLTEQLKKMGYPEEQADREVARMEKMIARLRAIGR